MKSITSSERRSLIRLASTLPEGSGERRALLAALAKVAMEHPSEKAKKKYLKEHPKADPSKHTVKGEGKGEGKEKESPGKSVSDVKVSPDDLTGDGKEAWDSLTEKDKKLVKDGVADALKAHSDDPQAFVNALAKEMDDWERAGNQDARFALYSITREYEKALGVDRE